MKIKQIFFKNSLRNFAYVISFHNEEINYCIDPFNAREVKNHLQTLKLSGIINTHDHCDHYSGNAELLQDFSCPVYAHRNAVIPGKTHNLIDQQVIYEGKCGDEEWSLVAVETPGHTMSHMCILLLKDKRPYALFTGDCFFNAGVGNCHNGGNVESHYETISTIFGQWPDELLIYPGHEYLKRNLEFTINVESDNQEALNYLNKISKINLDEVFFINDMKTERLINSFLRLDSLSIRKKLNLITSSQKEVFIELRQLRNKW